ncbi:dodecin domain-containing protein [Sphingorhabdus sp. Alg231-15]|uniref:dodecin domain-containing protein n=1 Tax=Sphingorhabdus sp. Alg231-15 TaxID=1922222 RepID=UPI000D550B49
MAVARVTEIISSSTSSIEDTVKDGVSRASQTLTNVQSAWVKDIKTVVTDGQVTEWRTTLAVTFLLEE